MQQKGFADSIKLRILGWGGLSRLSRWAQCCHSVLIKGTDKKIWHRQKRRRPRDNRGSGQSNVATGQGSPAATGSWQGQEQTLLEPLEEAQPCRRLDLSPTRPMSGF